MNETHTYHNGVGYTAKKAEVQELTDKLRERPGLEQTALTCVGFIATWHTRLGKDHPSVIRWIQEGKRGDELRELLMTLDLFEISFKTFLDHMHAMAKHHGLGACSASMEMCYQGKIPCQVHLHLFLGPLVTYRGCLKRQVPVAFPWSSLVWNESLPHIEPLRLTRGCGALERATRRGLYYVTMDKVGMLYRSSNVWPHED